MVLPVLEVERFGHATQSTIVGGARELIADGSIVIGLVILLFSVVVPLAKLLGMFLLCAGQAAMSGRHRAVTYRALEWIGKWGMIDVLLVATLVAAVKLGDLMEVTAGPGAIAFTAVVLLSMLATAVFDPASIWEESESGARA